MVFNDNKKTNFLDISEITDGAHKIDISFALQSLVFTLSVFVLFPYGFYLIIFFGDFEFERLDIIYLLSMFFIITSTYSLLNILMDDMLRLPFLKVSKALSILIILISIFFLLSSIFEIMKKIPLDSLQKLFYDAEENLAEINSSSLINDALLLPALIISNYLLLRKYFVEKALSKPIERRLLTGDYEGISLLSKIAFLCGSPAPYWKGNFAKKGTFWLFVFARILVWLGVFLILVIATVAAEDVSKDYPHILMALMAVSITIFILGHFLFTYSKNLSAKKILNIEQSNSSKKSPILFLRSFEDEQFEFKRSWKDPLGKWYDIWMFRRNLDEILIDEFSFYGEIIALGKTDDAKVPYGASRYYAEHENWQDVVKVTAQRAKAIVLVAGHTPGLLWEYKLIKENHFVNKTIFLFPPKSSEHREVAIKNFDEYFPSIISLGDTETVGIVVKDNDFILLKSERHESQAYLVSLRYFMRQFWKKQKPISVWWFSMVFIPIILFFLLLGILRKEEFSSPLFTETGLQGILQDAQSQTDYAKAEEILYLNFPKVGDLAQTKSFTSVLSKFDPENKYRIQLLSSDLNFISVMPDHTIFISTEISQSIYTNNGQIAYVLGHALGHSESKHFEERLSLARTVHSIAAAASINPEDASIQKQSNLEHYGLPRPGIDMPSFSLRHEVEADEIALQNMNDLGFDVCDSVQYMKQRLDKTSTPLNGTEDIHLISESRIQFLTFRIKKNFDRDC